MKTKMKIALIVILGLGATAIYLYLFWPSVPVGETTTLPETKSPAVAQTALAIPGTNATLTTLPWWFSEVAGGLMILAIIVFGNFALKKRREEKARKDTGGVQVSGPTGKSKLAWGLAIVGVIIVLLAVGWKPISDWWPSPTPEYGASRASAGKSATTDQWELCWTKMSDAKGINPSLREQCNPVVSAFNPEKPERLETQYMSLGIPRRSVLVWDPGSTTDGSWWQEHPIGGGHFHLEKNKSGLYQGWGTNSKDERTLIWLIRK